MKIAIMAWGQSTAGPELAGNQLPLELEAADPFELTKVFNSAGKAFAMVEVVTCHLRPYSGSRRRA
jgi:hypothetical protein